MKLRVNGTSGRPGAAAEEGEEMSQAWDGYGGRAWDPQLSHRRP